MTEMPTVDEAVLDDHTYRLHRARAQAQWELGDPSWADTLIDIYTGHDEPTDDAVEAYGD